MIIKYIKNSPVGLQEGTVQDVQENLGQRMIDSEYAKKGTKKELELFIKGIKDSDIERMEVLEEKRIQVQKEVEKAQEEAIAIAKKKDCGCSGKTEDCEECTEAEKLAAAKLLEENK